MNQRIIVLILAIVLAIGVACSSAPASGVETDLGSTTIATTEATAVGINERQPESVLVMNEAGGASDGTETATGGDEVDDTVRPFGWNDETHGSAADPNYAVVFPEDEVQTITISIDPEEWQAMLDDMTATYGEPGSGSGPGGGAGQGMQERLPDAPELGEAGARPARPDQGGPGMIGPGAGDFTTEIPIWVAADIEFEGDVWTDVGLRFKGNSSLMNTWSSGSLEMPFKLDFDEFEDENPAIENQRFYGFKQLSLSNNFNDATFMRDTVTSDIMAEAGITSAETAFYELFVDYGDGPVSFGLYTMIEVIDDTVIERVFGSDDGNIYESDGTAVSLAVGTFDGISSSFQKENNEDEANWGDIETLYTVLHSETRQTDPEAWKTELEAVFDVDTFLNWLAINTVIENWDTYGAMTHNFYLYNDPETGLLTWIPWDHNEALKEGRRSNVTLEMDGIGDEWPLISYLLADSEYYSAYVQYVDEAIHTVFVADEMAEKYVEIANLIEPYAAATVGADTFTQAVQALIDHTYDRAAEAERFLSEADQ